MYHECIHESNRGTDFVAFPVPQVVGDLAQKRRSATPNRPKQPRRRFSLYHKSDPYQSRGADCRLPYTRMGRRLCPRGATSKATSQKVVDLLEEHSHSYYVKQVVAFFLHVQRQATHRGQDLEAEKWSRETVLVHEDVDVRPFTPCTPPWTHGHLCAHQQGAPSRRGAR